MTKELVNKGSVFVLTSSYKDGDNELIGVFDSKDALLRRFAEIVAKDHKEAAVYDVPCLVASLVADLLQQGDHDECVDGKTRYGIAEYDVIGYSTKNRRTDGR